MMNMLLKVCLKYKCCTRLHTHENGILSIKKRFKDYFMQILSWAFAHGKNKKVDVEDIFQVQDNHIDHIIFSSSY